MTARLLTELALTPMRVATSATESWVKYASRNLPTATDPTAALRLGTDVLAWWNARTDRRAPRWAHESLVVRHWPLARLRDYSVRPADPMVPTVVLPPQAGHDSCIVDYPGGQSQLLTLREAGLSSLYSLDWIGADPSTANASIEDYLAVLADTVELVGGRVNLVGDCQGGWLATIYAALHPEQVNTLTVAGAPIDFHAGRGPLRDWTRLIGTLGRRTGLGPMAGYRAMVALGGGVQRGANQLLSFLMLEPASAWTRDLELFANIRDPDYLARYAEFADWFEWTQDIPGEFYLWIAEQLFQNNSLVTGELRIAGRTVDLGAIDCPLFLVAGTQDHITPAEQVFALAEHAGTPPDAVHRELVPGGHLGLFMGREALRAHWAPLMTKVHSLSTARPAAG